MKRTLKTFIPLGTNVLIRRDDTEEKSSGGIIIADTIKDSFKKNTGVVVKTGKLVTEVNNGDKVVFGGWASIEVEIEGVSYLIMKDNDVLAIL